MTHRLFPGLRQRECQVIQSGLPSVADKSRENQMDYAGLLIFIAIGAAAGWLAGILMKERSFGLLGNIIIGIIGAIAGGLLFGLLGLAGSILTAVAGAAVLLFLAWLIMKSRNQS
jgi:uncharacterized membrane protein YeaQ/YmgE (transglycosylase-associated protein family)